MNKKFLSLVLALVMVLGAFANVFAAAPEVTKAEEAKETEEVKVPAQKTNEAKIQWLIDHKIVEGRKVNEDPKDNDLALDEDVKRSEITKLLIFALGEEDLAKKLQGSVAIYPDVKTDYWANGVITVGSTVKSPSNKLPFLVGYDDGTFKPEQDVTYAELAKMLTVIAKEDLTEAMHDKANKVNWPSQWLVWANELGILDGVKMGDSSEAAPREDAFVMLYNTLYKMEDLRKVPANETRGIISAASVNSFTLNQGKLAKEFKVDADTVFVTGKEDNSTEKVINWNTLVNSDDKYYYGSFVRVLADEDGVVSHIVQLGNPVDGGIKSEGWRTVAEKVVSTYNYRDFPNVEHIASLDDDNKVLTVRDIYNNGEEVVLNLSSKTNYYVADYKNGNLTKVADLDEAVKYLNNKKLIGKVYAGYNVLPNSKVKEATEVVFNATKENDKSDIVRVVAPVDTNFNLTYNLPGVTQTKNETMNFRNVTDVFPFNHDLEKYDVIYLGERANDNIFRKLLINYSEDNIYKVVDVKEEQVSSHLPGKEDDKMNYAPGRRLVELKLSDGRGEKWFDVVADAKIFFGDELKKDAYVQVAKDEAKTNLLSVISVVPAEKTRGELPEATPLNEETGVVKATRFADPGFMYVEIAVDDSKYTDVYVVSGDEADKLVIGEEYTFKTKPSNNEQFKNDLAYKFEPTQKTLDAREEAKVNKATELVDKYVANLSSANKEAAKSAISELKEGEAKDKLQARFDDVAAANEAIYAFEQAKKQEELDKARKAIDKVKNDADRAKLHETLDANDDAAQLDATAFETFVTNQGTALKEDASAAEVEQARVNSLAIVEEFNKLSDAAKAKVDVTEANSYINGYNINVEDAEKLKTLETI